MKRGYDTQTSSLMARVIATYLRFCSCSFCHLDLAIGGVARPETLANGVAGRYCRALHAHHFVLGVPPSRAWMT
jgi:hypothetical protein